MSEFIEVNTDLHMHGKYAGAVSEQMIPSVIGEQAPLKGLKLVGTGDILNERWIKLVKEQLKQESEDILSHGNGTKFILQVEIEDINRVHHIVVLPSMSKVYELREKFKNHCKNLDSDGRPKIRLPAEQIAEAVTEAGGIVGFSHAFTPFFGLYAHFNSYKECYGSQAKNIHFMELGLSADTNMADRIEELHQLTFTSNSDAHSPWPNKLGREFTRLKMKEVSFDELSKALRREGGRGSTLNVKFNPLEGKYHLTRCKKCLLFFKPEIAAKSNWRCPACKGIIKKGVDFRIDELSKGKELRHPDYRPKCLHTIPLSEIIAIAHGIKNAWSQKVQAMWRVYVDRFGNEITALIDTPIEELHKIDPKTADLVKLFREEKFNYVPGGAGIYGIPVPPGKPFEVKYYEFHQKSLGEY